jgi:EF-P beta-lysylation protein EpmB
MIARSPPLAEPDAWVAALREAYSSPGQLLEDLGLAPDAVGLAAEAARHFSFRVPRPFASRMVAGDPDDPLLRQVLPRGEELVEAPDFVTDPVGDRSAQRSPALLHKYSGRGLLMLTGGCAINCRYCFRREFPYADAVGSVRLEAAVEVLREDTSLTEVILSGGDPLLWEDSRLASLIDGLEAIPHLSRLRIHTRLPVVLPQRVTPALCDRLAGSRLSCAVVLHANHPRELDGEVAAACADLRRSGITLLNQAVLLRGVNDDCAVLAMLSERLFALGVLPYYLHLLDRVRGASHFEVSEERALELYRALHARLPGYLLPRLAREEPGAPGKTLRI